MRKKKDLDQSRVSPAAKVANSKWTSPVFFCNKKIFSRFDFSTGSVIFVILSFEMTLSSNGEEVMWFEFIDMIGLGSSEWMWRWIMFGSMVVKIISSSITTPSVKSKVSNNRIGLEISATSSLRGREPFFRTVRMTLNALVIARLRAVSSSF